MGDELEMNNNQKLNITKLVLLILTVVNVGILVYINNQVQELNTKVAYLQQRDYERTMIDKKIVDSLDSMSKIMIQEFDQQKQDKIKQSAIKNKQIDRYSDINKTIELSANDMNKIIDFWDTHVKNGTPFKGKGEVFIKASKETGVDPVVILAHAAYESNWGKSPLAQDRGNYFGINAVDSNPNKAYKMGDSMEEGIVQGYVWVKQNFYDQGCTNLHDMIYKGNYASAKDRWINNITSIVNTSYRVLSV
jgi:beta-N-acetylglucosaminidase